MQRFYRYIEDVQSGKVLTNRYIKAAVKRTLSYMEKSKDPNYPYRFDEEKAQKAINFVEHCKHYKGEWAGKNIHLEPWQVFFYANIYGFVRKDNGMRMIRKAFCFVGRKNGKSLMVSPVLIRDALSTNGGEAYCLATKKDQAKIVFENVKQMVRQDPVFSKHLKVYTSMNRIVCNSRASKIEALASESNMLDGLNPSVGIIDEVSAMKDFSLINVIESGTGAQPQPLLIEITSGSDNVNSAGAAEFERSKKILDGFFEDDSFFTLPYTLDDEDSWQDTSKYIKANPNLGVSISLEYLKRMRDQAIQQPYKEGEFRTKNLNQYISPETAWISAKAWAICKNNAIGFEFDSAEWVCVGAVDLSHRLDFSAYSLCFYNLDKGKYFFRHHFYIPEGQIEAKCRTDSELVRHWISRGLITATPGDVIDYSYIFNDMEEDIETYHPKELLFDPWDSGELRKRMAPLIDLVEIPQSMKVISPMAKDYEAEILNGNVIDGNEVEGWMISNCDVYRDPNDNIKPVKHGGKDSPYHIDGVVTAVMSLGRIRQLLLEGSLDNRTIDEIMADMEQELAQIDY